MRRTERLRVLIAELAVRDMDRTAMAIFLDCSPSAVRAYLDELVNSAVVRSRGKHYRLSDDAFVVDGFLMALTAPPSGQLQVRRDPLVAALFGAACAA